MDYTGVADLLKNDLIDLFLDFLFQDIGLSKDLIESDFLFQDIGLSKDQIESDFLFQNIGLSKYLIESDFLFQDIGLSKDLIESFRRHLENSEMLNVDFSIQVKLCLLNTVVSININTVLLKLGYNFYNLLEYIHRTHVIIVSQIRTPLKYVSDITVLINHFVLIYTLTNVENSRMLNLPPILFYVKDILCNYTN